MAPPNLRAPVAKRDAKVRDSGRVGEKSTTIRIEQRDLMLSYTTRTWLSLGR